MRSLIAAAALVLAAPSIANATIWVAKCTDGKNVQYNQYIFAQAPNNGFLYLYTQSNAGVAVTELTLVSMDANTVCGGSPGGIGLICADKAAGQIFLKVKSPSGTMISAGPFCKATVTVH